MKLRPQILTGLVSLAVIGILAMYVGYPEVAAACPAASHEGLDDDDLAGEADQDRGQSDSTCQVRHLPDGGGCSAAAVVPGDP